ncbi:hypothetical protein ACF064_36355 [Streptomyces sp. NPDC015492]|uniref:hypothetical protein n=1 Tax=Streptomyces sp. NPDC015492 TaxID=3364958 RepID=UPI0036F51B98
MNSTGILARAPAAVMMSLTRCGVLPVRHWNGPRVGLGHHHVHQEPVAVRDLDDVPQPQAGELGAACCDGKPEQQHRAVSHAEDVVGALLHD